MSFPILIMKKNYISIAFFGADVISIPILEKISLYYQNLLNHIY